MSLYLDSGYLNIEYLDNRDLPFNIVMGGRGTGKTYGVLKHYLQSKETIIYMRQSQIQADIAGNVDFTPYKSVCRDLHLEYQVGGTGKIRTIETETEILAYVIALSTFHNVRGFDATDCKAIVYDEFIPEKQGRAMKNEGEALLNAYETVNRNRELNGNPPLKLWLLANTNNFNSPVLTELGIIDVVYKMQKRNQEQYIDRDLGLQIIMLQDSPISERKAETGLYRLAKTRYKTMALGNKFELPEDIVRPANLKEYTPYVKLDDITIYKHKSNNSYYATTHKTGTVEEFKSTSKDMAVFFRKYRDAVTAYRYGYMNTETSAVYAKLESIFC